MLQDNTTAQESEDLRRFKEELIKYIEWKKEGAFQFCERRFKQAYSKTYNKQYKTQRKKKLQEQGKAHKQRGYFNNISLSIVNRWFDNIIFRINNPNYIPKKEGYNIG